jgi:DNA-binding transcriptional MerR regulator
MATVSRLTGFKPDLLRAWESRHQLLAPERGPGGQRLYSDKDVAVLHSVRALLAEGRSIGEIALMGRRRLAELARDGVTPREGSAHREGGAHRQPSAPPPPAPTWPGHARSDNATTRALQIAARAVARLSTRLDPAPLLQLLCDTLATDFQAALARIWVTEPSGNLLWLRASAGLSRQTTRSSRARIDLRTYRFKVGVVGRSGQPFVSNDIVGDPDFDQRWVREERLAAVAILPLLADDTSYGVMAAFFRVALNDDVSGALRMFSAIAAGCLQSHEEIVRDARRPSIMINT